MSGEFLNTKYQHWQNQLLDLGKRNKMINYRETKRATMKLLEPEFEELFQRVAVDEEAMTFQRTIDRESDIRVYSVLSLLENLSCPMEVYLGDIKSEGSIPERQKTLKQLRAKSRLALEEQGINILYMASGFMEWRMNGDPDSARVKSPLILVPVTLTVESFHSPYILKKYEDDIVINPTLSYLLERDYGITLPGFDPEEESVSDFLDQVEKLVDQRGWKIVRENNIGLVSFLKINMYKDLENNEQSLKANPIIRAFAGEKNGVTGILEELPDIDYDRIPSADKFQVVNADSSQEDAILLSRQGVSFVMQGPPGTGKSQTITNIIAQGLADGKKILFVSEKAAALEVVHKRLTEVHLADFCLALHSYKANKKEVLEELRKSLELTGVRVKDEELAGLSELDMLKEQLKQHIDDIHTPIPPLQMSLYEAYGALVSLAGYPDLVMPLEHVEQVSKDQLNRLCLLVEAFDQTKSVLGSEWYKNPWSGTTIRNVTYELSKQIKERFERVIDCFEQLLANEADINRICDCSFELQISRLGSYERLLQLLSGLQDIPAEWVDEVFFAKSRSIAERNTQLWNVYLADTAYLQNHCNSTFLAVNAGRTIETLTDLHHRIDAAAGKGYAAWTERIAEYRSLSVRAGAYAADLQTLGRNMKAVEAATGCVFERTFAGLIHCAFVSDLILAHPYMRKEWFDSRQVRQTESLLKEYEHRLKVKTEIQVRWRTLFSDDIYGLGLEKQADEYRRWFSGPYAAGTETMKGYDLERHLERLQSEYAVFTRLRESLKLDPVTSFTEQGVEYPVRIDDIDSYTDLLMILTRDMQPGETWQEPQTQAAFADAVHEGRAKSRQYHELRQTILRTWEPDIFSLDYEGILLRYKTEYNSVFKAFRKSYRADKKALRAVWKTVTGKISDSQIGEVLRQLKELDDIKAWFAGRQEEYAGLLGGKFAGFETAWEELAKDRDLFDRACSREQLRPKLTGIISGFEQSQKDRVYHEIGLWTEFKQAAANSLGITWFDTVGMEPGVALYAKVTEDVKAACEVLGKLNEHYLIEDPLSVSEAAMVLDSLADYYYAEQFMAESGHELAKEFGDCFAGAHSRFDLLHNYLANAGRLNQLFTAVPERLIELLTGAEMPSTELGYTEAQVRELAAGIGTVFSGMVTEQEACESISNRLAELLALLKEALAEYDEAAGHGRAVLSPDEVMEALSRLQRVREYEALVQAGTADYKQCFGRLFAGIETVWPEVLNMFEAFSEAKQLSRTLGISEQGLAGLLNAEYHGITIGLWSRNMEQFHRAEPDWEWITTLFDHAMTMDTRTVRQIRTKLKSCCQNVDSLEHWIDYRDSRRLCIDNGLEPFIVEAEDNIYQDGALSKIFQKAYYLKWITAVSGKTGTVAAFKGRVQNSRVKRFRYLDAHQLPVAQMRIREKLIQGLPDRSHLSRVSDEMSVLQHELNKKRKIMPLRKLFGTIPNLLLKLKPCLMMSPLSVAYFLEAKTYSFDMVIFDEASQIFPQDAVGAVLRGRQVIIAGDSKQLPPTNFFSANTNNYDSEYDPDDETEEEVIYDSILEEAASCLPNRSLLWHYRSRNEDLISFSNHYIYNNHLITFPGSVSRAADSGVEYIYVEDGVYANRCNAKEALRCVELVREHIQKHPERTLGIIAFSEKQQTAIEDAVWQFRAGHPEFEFFFAEQKEEAFFVKNLENVQGDERDTIIFSICYARSTDGRMYMRFGPLGQQGGERRLNVAVTRAKQNVKLVGSILPEDIDLRKTHSEGARMLRAYIEFAIKGSETLPIPQKHDLLSGSDEFCTGVAAFLTGAGYQVEMRVGKSDYTVDIAVKHPHIADVYVVGIECDGSSYREARTARDRDSLRSHILEQMGWRMYRVWSTEWINNYEGETRQLLSFIKTAVSEYAVSESTDERSALPPDEPVKTEAVVKPEVPAADHQSNPYGFEYYEEGQYLNTAANHGPGRPAQLADYISAVVRTEQPIHIELLYRRLIGAFGKEKVTKPIRDTIDSVLRDDLNSEVIIEDKFVRLTDMREVKVRIPKAGETRDIGFVSLPEITAAMCVIISHSYGLEESQLIIETARVFGYVRTGPKITGRMSEAIALLLDTGTIRIIDGKIQFSEEYECQMKPS